MTLSASYTRIVRTCVEDCFEAETPPNICAARSPSIDKMRFGSWCVPVLNLKMVLFDDGGDGGSTVRQVDRLRVAA